METVKIVFDVDSKDIKSTTDELKALNKVTNDEVVAMEKLSNSAQDAGEGFVSLRTRVKQAKEEAVKAAEKYGEFSKEAQAAKEKAGALADQMGDLNRQVNLLNPEAKAKAFSNLAQGVVGAFSIATGALQAFGVKNKEVEALAMKLQAALNITQGIASLKGLKESLDDVKVVLGFTTAAQEALTVATEAEAVATTEATVATKGFTASLLTNPIFLTVAAIGALVGAYIALNNETEIAILNEEELKKLRDENKKLIDDEKKSTIDLAVAKEQISKQEGERRKIELQRSKDVLDRTQKEQDLLSLQVESDAKIKKGIQDIADLRKWAAEERNLELKKDIQSSIYAAESQLKAEQEKNKKIRSQRATILEGIKAINKKALDETQIQNEEEIKENKAKNDKIAAENKLKAEKKRKDLQQEIDKIMADAEAAAAIEAQKSKERNDKKLAIEKQLQNEINRARLLAVSGDKIAELQVQMDILDEKYAADLFNLERTAKTEEEYRDVKATLDAKYANDQIEINNKTTDIAIANADKEVKANEDKNAKITKSDQERLAKQKEIGEGIANSLQFITDSLVQGDQAAREEELAQLEDQKNKKIISEEEYQKKLKVIKQKQAEDAKRAAIYNATLDLSRAIIAALTIPPPGSVIAANFAAALAGANLLRIIATPIPKFQKGTLAVPGVDMGRDSVHAMLQPGEAVIPVSTNRAYHPTIRAIYEKKISPSEINNFVMSRTSSGGKQSLTASVDTFALSRALGKNKGVQIENAQVVGRVIAKELNTYNVRRGW